MNNKYKTVNVIGIGAAVFTTEHRVNKNGTWIREWEYNPLVRSKAKLIKREFRPHN